MCPWYDIICDEYATIIITTNNKKNRKMFVNIVTSKREKKSVDKKRINQIKCELLLLSPSSV